MRVTSRQLRHIIQQTLHEIASDENDEEALDEDEAWAERGEWPIVQEPGSPPPLSRRERELARTSARQAPASKPISDPRTVGAAYVSGPAPGEPFDPRHHRGEFPALPEEELEEEMLDEGSMTMTATQLRQVISESLSEMFGGHRSNPPRGGYGPLTLPDVVRAFQAAGFKIYDGQAKQIQEKLNADGRDRRDLEQRLARLTHYESRSVYNTIDAVMAG